MNFYNGEHIEQDEGAKMKVHKLKGTEKKDNLGKMTPTKKIEWRVNWKLWCITAMRAGTGNY